MMQGLSIQENSVILLNFAILSMTRLNEILGNIRSRRDGMKNVFFMYGNI